MQECALETAEKIFKVLNMTNFSNHFIDFNLTTFEKDSSKIIPEWDWCIFQAIYRTKELIDIEKVFKYVVDHTKEGIIFEGNGDLHIDTEEFYYDIFKPFKFSDVKFLGRSQQRPAFLITK